MDCYAPGLDVPPTPPSAPSASRTPRSPGRSGPSVHGARVRRPLMESHPQPERPYATCGRCGAPLNIFGECLGHCNGV